MSESIDHSSPELSPAKSGLAAGFAVALTGLALLPCVVPTTPVAYFESDPRIDLGFGQDRVLTDLGPAAVAWVQWLTVLVAAGGLIAAAWCGVRLSKVALALAGLGVVAAVVHATKGTARWEDWTQAGAWIAAAMAGLSAMHLAQLESARRWVVALCAAAAVPLLAEAGWYVWVEHPESVAFFETHREELLAARGIAPGSEAAALYERRLRFADATGTFGLSNVLASVAGVLGMVSVGCLIGTVRKKTLRAHGGAIAAAGVSAAAALTVVGLTASKGAAVAVAMVIGLAVVVGIASRVVMVQKLVPAAAVGLVAVALAAVLVRGAMGPPAAPPDGFVAGAAIEGERSLLFRWHYFTAAGEIAAGHPVIGSGARGFADLYPSAKNPINPESVTSAHSVFVDQITMLGVGGWAWSGLLLWWLWRAGRAAAAPSTDDGKSLLHPPCENGFSPDKLRTSILVALAASVCLFGVMLVVRQSTLYLDSALAWLVAIGGFIAIAAVLGTPGALSERAQRIALLLAAAMALVHNQVEMAFFQPPSMGVLWLILGAAGAGLASSPRPKSSDAEEAQTVIAPAGKPSLELGLAGIAGLAVLVVTGVLAVGVTRHEQAMAGAEAALRRGDTTLAIERLAEAQDAAGLDTRALRWRVQLHAFDPMRALTEMNRTDEAQMRLGEAIAWLEDAVPEDRSPTTVTRLRASLLERAALEWGGEERFAAAESAFAALAMQSPYNIQDRLARADLAWAAGNRDVARQRYAEVLELREQKYLDPADPLSPNELERVRQVIAEVDSESQSAEP